MAHNGTSAINGVAKKLSKEEIARRTLGDGNPVSGNYRPSFPLGYYGPDIVPLFMILWDVERMLQHPQVAIAMCHYKSAIANAEFEVKGSSQAAADYYMAMIQRFWERSLHHAQGSYHFGWQGLEVMYDIEDNRLVFDSTLDFSPRDVKPLTMEGKLYAVRVQNIEGINGPVDLWSPRSSRWADDQLPDIPAKGFWHAHNPTHHRWYGRTQLYSSWRPWRRLTGMDGAENIIDGGMYRSAYQGPLVRYPEEGGYDENDNQLSFRDKARELAEKAKNGVSVAMPSTRNEGGYLKWELEWGKFNAQGLETLIAYVDYLRAEIHQGIGVPAELIEASETGSGYSGRAIPMEGFLMGQMLNAQAILKSFCEQVADPLLRWNFGQKAWAKAKVKDLLQTKNKAAMGGQGQQPPPQPAAPMPAPQDQAPQDMAPQAPDPLAELLGGNLSTLRLGQEDDDIIIGEEEFLSTLFGGNLSTLRHQHEDDDVIIEEETFLSLMRLAGNLWKGPFTGERGGTYWLHGVTQEKRYQSEMPTDDSGYVTTGAASPSPKSAPKASASEIAQKVPEKIVEKATVGEKAQGKTESKITFGGDKARTEALIKKLLGKDATAESVAILSGAPPGSNITLSYHPREKDFLIIALDHNNGQMIGERFIYHDEGKLILHNDFIRVKEGSRAKGLGAKMLDRQVKEAVRLGINEIRCDAQGHKNDPTYSGYAVWPKLGYDGMIKDAEISPKTRAVIEKKFPGAEKISDILKAPGGSEFWTEHGATFAATFDLSEGSYSRRVLEKYMQKKFGTESQSEPPKTTTQAESEKPTEKAKGILARIASLPGKLIPDRVKNAAGKVKEKMIGGLKSRYGERGAKVILKAAMIAAPIPVPGAQPATIVASLIIAECVLGWRKLRRPAVQMSIAGLSSEEIQQAAEKFWNEALAEAEKLLGDSDEG